MRKALNLKIENFSQGQRLYKWEIVSLRNLSLMPIRIQKKKEH